MSATTDQDKEKGSRGNYVAAWTDYAANKVVVLERDPGGNLQRVEHDAPYYFYVAAEQGDYRSIFGDTLAKIAVKTRREYDAAREHARVRSYKRFESDIPPLKRVLMDCYYDRPTPPVNYAFFDIEVDYTQSRGFAGPTNPYAPINAVTVYQSWTGTILTAAVPPPGWGGGVDDLHNNIQSLIDQGQLRPGPLPQIHICRDERELTDLMLGWLTDADILSGWNSELYDIPYICERLLILGGEALLARLEYSGARTPRKDTVRRFGSQEPVYRFTGKGHIDYMRAFQKFNTEGRASYSLGNLLEEEVGVGKLHYDGTLEQLYRNDFPSFVAYNFRDVDGLVQLDTKFRFIALINQMAHENTVLFDAILGTVEYVETGITNYAHHRLQKRVPDKSNRAAGRVEGAVVLTPKPGVHENIGSVDVRSLYPNTIRSLNISPEKIVGQFANKEQAWHEVRAQSDAQLTLTLENGESATTSAAEWRELLLQHRWAVSGFGTVFDQSTGPGLLAEVLGYWYAERMRLQAEKRNYATLAHDETDPDKKAEYLRLEAHYDLLQLARKNSMNSLYGAMLSPGFRFGDERLGASTTGTGRQITTHIIETIAQILTDQPHRLHKTKRVDAKGTAVNEYSLDTEAIIYGDTDSCYFKTGSETVAEAIVIADSVARQVNESFPQFMREACLCQPGFDGFLSVGREIVGSRGLFLAAKKKYTIKVVDKEGTSCDKLKSMGSDIKRSDTPKVIQAFMAELMEMILDGKPRQEVEKFANDRRAIVFGRESDPLDFGVAKQVNNLKKYLAEYNKPPKIPVKKPSSKRISSDSGGEPKKVRKPKRAASGLTVPGHCRAALNYNRVLSEHEPGARPIRSGDKVLTFYLLQPNRYAFKSIALPAEAVRFPQWFAEHFQIDVKRTQAKLFDRKLKGIFEALIPRHRAPIWRYGGRVEKAARRWLDGGVGHDARQPSGQYRSVNVVRDFLSGFAMLQQHCHERYRFYGFECQWAYFRALYAAKSIHQLVDEFTTDVKREGILQWSDRHR